MTKITDVQRKHYNTLIKRADMLSNLLKNEAWTEVIHPLWEYKIAQQLGGKVGNRYFKGDISKCRKEEPIAYRVGARNGLIDFYNDLQNIITDGERARATIDKSEKEKAKTPVNEFIKERFQRKLNVKNNKFTI